MIRDTNIRFSDRDISIGTQKCLTKQHIKGKM